MEVTDSFDDNQSLSMDLLDTDVFFSTEQLGVSELDMAGLTDVDLATLDNKLTDHQIDETDWSISNSADLDLQPSDFVQFGDESEQPSLAESDTSNQSCLDDDFQKMLTDWENHIGTGMFGSNFRWFHFSNGENAATFFAKQCLNFQGQAWPW